MLALEGEVASDLSAFHRIDNMWCMGSRRWAQLVPRLYAYAGAVKGRMEAIMAQEQNKSDQSSIRSAPTAGGGGVEPVYAPDGTELLPGPPSPWQDRGGQEVEATQTALRMSPIGDMFSFGTA